jgi:hypothetical protein
MSRAQARMPFFIMSSTDGRWAVIARSAFKSISAVRTLPALR